MATIDEILAAMPDTAAEDGREYLVIDPDTRSIAVPESERIFGVTGDELADRKYFMCPRYVGDGLDLAGMFIRVNYRNAGGDEDGYLVDDVAVVGDYVTFSWRLWPKVTEYKGAIQFGVCADLPNTTERRFPDWNTTMASGEVLEGLHPYDGAVEEETRDVVTQLREMVTAQTAAVEATGANQVDVVEAAGAAATADAQAQIEAKGAATLATIPEDYAAMAGKVNEQANAIKGHMSGEIVQAGDVSPVEHYLGVKVQGKNLLNLDAGLNACLVKNADGSYTIQKTDGNRFSEKIPISARAGDKITCRVRGIGADGHASLYVQVNFADGTSKGMSFDNETDTRSISCPADAKNARVYIPPDGADGAYKRFESIQLELGTEATEYTPYIDPAGVTVTRCGKNLTAHTAETKTDKQSGISLTRTKNSAVFIVDGTATQMSSLVATATITLPPGTYTASVQGLNKIDGGTDRVYLWNQPDGKVVQNGIMEGTPKTFTLTAATPVRAELVFAAGSSYSNHTVKIQIEQGSTATAFEEYTGATAMPDESGAVTGLPSAAPTMTLLTDTAGVTIDCTYNRDTNAVYAEILEKIAALGGTI